MAKQKENSDYKVLIPFLDSQNENKKFEIGDNIPSDTSDERIAQLLKLEIIEKVS